MCHGDTENTGELVEKPRETFVLAAGHCFFRADSEKRWLITNENVHFSAVSFVEATIVAELSIRVRSVLRRSSRRLLIKEALGSQFFQSRLKSSKSLAEKASKGHCRGASMSKWTGV